MKIWMCALSVAFVCMTLTACGANKEGASEGDNKNKPEKSPQETSKPTKTIKQPAEKQPDDKQPVAVTPVIPADDQVDGSEAIVPKSRVFGAIGRAFFRGGTEGGPTQSQPDPNEETE